MRAATPLAVAVGIVVAAPVRADLITIGALKDNTIFEVPSGNSSGAGPFFFAGNNSMGQTRRGLLAFDVASAVPAGSIVNSVTLTLHMSQSNAGPESIGLHGLLQDWGEGTSSAPGGNGVPATPGDATWLDAFTPGVQWTTPGGHFDPLASATTVVGGVGFYQWGSAGLVSDVQAWLDAPATNFGWLLQGNETGMTTTKRFDSRQNGTPEFRPMLSIDFSTVPAPGGLAALLLPLLGSRRRKI